MAGLRRTRKAMIDPRHTDLIARDRQRELLLEAERARMVRDALGGDMDRKQWGFRARLRDLAGRIFGTQASDLPAGQSEEAPEDRPTAA